MKKVVQRLFISLIFIIVISFLISSLPLSSAENLDYNSKIQDQFGAGAIGASSYGDQKVMPLTPSYRLPKPLNRGGVINPSDYGTGENPWAGFEAKVGGFFKNIFGGGNSAVLPSKNAIIAEKLKALEKTDKLREAEKKYASKYTPSDAFSNDETKNSEQTETPEVKKGTIVSGKKGEQQWVSADNLPKDWESTYPVYTIDSNNNIFTLSGKKIGSTEGDTPVNGEEYPSIILLPDESKGTRFERESTGDVVVTDSDGIARTYYFNDQNGNWYQRDEPVPGDTGRGESTEATDKKVTDGTFAMKLHQAQEGEKVFIPDSVSTPSPIPPPEILPVNVEIPKIPEPSSSEPSQDVSTPPVAQEPSTPLNGKKPFPNKPLLDNGKTCDSNEDCKSNYCDMTLFICRNPGEDYFPSTEEVKSQSQVPEINPDVENTPESTKNEQPEEDLTWDWWKIVMAWLDETKNSEQTPKTPDQNPTPPLSPQNPVSKREVVGDSKYTIQSGIYNGKPATVYVDKDKNILGYMQNSKYYKSNQNQKDNPIQLMKNGDACSNDGNCESGFCDNKLPSSHWVCAAQEENQGVLEDGCYDEEGYYYSNRETEEWNCDESKPELEEKGDYVWRTCTNGEWDDSNWQERYNIVCLGAESPYVEITCEDYDNDGNFINTIEENVDDYTGCYTCNDLGKGYGEWDWNGKCDYTSSQDFQTQDESEVDGENPSPIPYDDPCIGDETGCCTNGEWDNDCLDCYYSGWSELNPWCWEY